jgi:hypothetical protein
LHHANVSDAGWRDHDFTGDPAFCSLAAYCGSEASWTPGDPCGPARLPSEDPREEPVPDVAEQALAEMRGVVRRMRRQLHDYLYAVPEADDGDQEKR